MVHVRLLGSMGIEVDGVPVEIPASRRAQALLGWLVLHPGTHSRSQLAGRFWPDVLDASARASLRSAVWALRRSLRDGESVLIGSRDELGLDGVTTDRERFASLFEAGDFEAALELCRGELLAGLDDDWVYEARDEHRAQVAAALAQLTARAGDARAAVGWARRWTALDPLSEPAARALMEALAAAGERPAAIAVYTRLRERMRIELGMSPAVETRAVYVRVRDDDERQTTSSNSGLVGRRAELARLEQHRRAAAAGAGGVVLLSGEGGIGKTRLATELLERARAEGARVATCAAMDLGGTAPFGLWAELLRELARDLAPIAPGTAWAADIAPLAPDVGHAPSPSATPELERARLFEGAVGLFEHACSDRPLVVLIEDLHVADPASVELAAYVGRRTPAMPALIVVTRRPAPRSSDADALAASLTRRGALLDSIALGPLPHAEVIELINSVATLEGDAAERVAHAAEGNPLLAVETARAAVAGEHGPAATLRTAVRAQVDALDDDARLLAELVAVAGREIDRAEAAALPLAALADAATAAADSGLIVAADRRIGFRHALLRDAVYEDLPDPRRAELHETLAGALTATAHGEPGHRDAEVARHLLLAGREDRAVEHLARAAAHARGVAALPEAAGFLREALAIAPDDHELWMELAMVEAYNSHGEAAEYCYQRADALLDRGPAPLQAAACMRRARWFRGALCDPGTARAAYRRALGLLDGAGLDEPRQRAEALAGVGLVRGLRRRHRRRRRPARAGGRAAHGHRDGRPARPRLRRRAGVRVHPPRRVPRLLRAGHRGGRRGHARRPPRHGLRRLGQRGVGGRGGRRVRPRARAGRPLARRRPQRRGPAARVRGPRGALLHPHAHAPLRRGEPNRCAPARELADLLDRDDLRAGADHDAGLVALARGDHEAAAVLLGAALDGGARVSRPLTRIARAEALAKLGRPDDAEQELRARPRSSRSARATTRTRSSRA